MKKRLFSVMSVFALFAYNVNAQQTATLTVKSNTDVKVTSGALLYVNGEMKVDNYTSPDKKVSNEGNIHITKKLENKNSTGGNFVNEFSGEGSYGQLIVNGEDANVGKIKTIVKLNSGFVYHSLAIPYEGVTALNLVEQLYPKKEKSEIKKSFVGYKYANGQKKYFDPNRKKNPLFTWDKSNYYLRQLSEGELIDPVAYYAINKGSALGEFDTSAVSSIEGQPAKKTYEVNLKGYKVGNSLDSNPVGEYYGSYIFDYTQEMPSDWTNYKKEKPGVEAGSFGSNIFDLANPYTSNIDLSKLDKGEFLSKVKTLVQYSGETYNEDVNTGGASDAYGKKSSFNAFVPGQGTGDSQLGFVRPFQTFSVKMVDDFVSANLIFNDKVKTFEAEANTPNILYKKGIGVPEVNQVGVDVVDSNGVLVGKAYVVASAIYDAAQQGEGVEVYNVALDDNSIGIYTLQENEDGTINEELSKGKTYINGVNEAYIAKPIHLVFQNGKGKYSFRVRLNDALKNNKNAFYLEDRKQGKVVKLIDGETIPVNVNGTEKDRFVMYWASTPKKELNEEITKDAIGSSIVVYKEGDIHKIKFDKSIKKADVFVYNISGQLISVDRDVNTQTDYIVPIRYKSSVYIIKIVDDKGKIVTKKIIK